MSNIQSEDPRITAYALGELEGDELAAFERELEQDAALRAAVDEVRQTANMLAEQLAAEPAPRLTEAQREAIERRPEPAALNAPLIFRARALWWSVGAAAAACLVLAIVLPNLDRVGGPNERLVAREIEQAPAGIDQFGFDSNGAPRAGQSVGDVAPTDVRAMRDRAVVEAAAGLPEYPENRLQLAGEPSSSRESTVTSAAAPSAQPMAGGVRAMIAPPQLPDPRLHGSGPSGGAAGAPAARKPAPGSGPRSEAGQAGFDVHLGVENSMGQGGRRQATSDQAGERWRKAEEEEGEARFGFTWNREEYNPIVDNPFIKPQGQAALSTFSIDVDTASYANVRRYLNAGQLPPKDAVRIEELLNYFSYSYEPPTGEDPFSANMEVMRAPWNTEHHLVRIGLKGKEIKTDMRPATSLVFLIDVSGSMQSHDKLPLVKQSLLLLVERLHADDRLAIVTYAGSSGVLLDSIYCSVDNKQRIIEAINGLHAGGSTNGAGGIVTAYDVATRHFIEGGVNRVILCTDGDFNVGVSSEAELVRLIEAKRATGVFLSVLGFGSGNYQDAKMEQLANHGNGNFAYIDSLEEARRVLVERMAGTLVTIAKDVKIQVEFNPAKVAAYRLIGYENRVLAAQDFNDDRKDAGEIGAGHAVTALYEIIPLGVAQAEAAGGEVDDLKYQKPAAPIAADATVSDELLTLKLRYKQPDGDASQLIELPLCDAIKPIEEASSDTRFAAAVAAFGMLLRDSPYKGNATYSLVLDLAESGEAARDESRAEFMNLVRQAQALSRTRD